MIGGWRRGFNELGYDTPRSLGSNATGGALAVPIFQDFMRVARADRPAVPFRVPTGIKLIRIDPRTGLRAGALAGGAAASRRDLARPGESVWVRSVILRLTKPRHGNPCR